MIQMLSPALLPKVGFKIIDPLMWALLYNPLP